LVPTWKIENAMLIRPLPPEIQEIPTGFVRRRCRNSRCGGKLRQETNNPRAAFCCRGCLEQHYRKLCLVCERPLRRKTEQQRFCTPKCKFAFRRHPERFLGIWANVPAAQRTPHTSARKSGLKTRAKGQPTWRVIAGPAAGLDPLNLVTPLDPDTAARVRRANDRAWIDETPIAGAGWPVILIGGGDLEQQLVHQGRQLNPKQEK
jgi:hypothetical protein